MSSGAFRDAGAAFERVAALEQQNQDLEAELARLREGTAAIGDAAARDRELTKLRAELKATLTKLSAATRDLQAVESNYRAAKKKSDGAADESLRLNTEIAHLKDLLARALVAEPDRSRTSDLLPEVRALRERLAEATAQIASLQQALGKTTHELLTARARVVEPMVVTEVPENLGAFVKRVQEERDELLVEVRELRAKLERR